MRSVFWSVVIREAFEIDTISNIDTAENITNRKSKYAMFTCFEASTLSIVIVVFHRMRFQSSTVEPTDLQ